MEMDEKQVEEKQIEHNLNTNIDYINYIIKELQVLKWEHSWMESYEKDNKLDKIGIEPCLNYKGIAQYCRCYICRPNMYSHLKTIIDKIK